MHKQAIKHKQAIIGGGYLFTKNACLFLLLKGPIFIKKHNKRDVQSQII